jgi:hypothetical protein
MRLSNEDVVIQTVTLLVKFHDGVGEQEERFVGFLTGAEHAMYVEEDYGNLIFVKIVETLEPNVYEAVKGFNELGNIKNSPMDAEATVKAVATKLHHMTAYQFFTDIMVESSKLNNLQKRSYRIGLLTFNSIGSDGASREG